MRCVSHQYFPGVFGLRAPPPMLAKHGTICCRPSLNGVLFFSPFVRFCCGVAFAGNVAVVFDVGVVRGRWLVCGFFSKVTFEEEPWKSVSNNAKEFILKLLKKDPRKRLTAQQASTPCSSALSHAKDGLRTAQLDFCGVLILFVVIVTNCGCWWWW